MKKLLFFFLEKIPLKTRLNFFYWIKFRKKLDLDNPILYSEKIQKRKFNLLSDYSILSDKYRVRKFVREKIGDSFLISLIGVYDNPNEIDFSNLPNEFVIKTNFGSGSKHIEIVKNKNLIKTNDIVKKFNLALKNKYKGSLLGENQYDLIDKKIIIEEFINNNGSGLDDFKFHIFNSSDGFLQIDFDRFTNHKRNLYDLDFKRLDYDLCYTGGDYHLPSILKLNKMKDLAFQLSQGFDYVRVDLYLVKDQIFFGEMTFTPGNGFERFSKPEADKLYGQMWKQR